MTRKLPSPSPDEIAITSGDAVLVPAVNPKFDAGQHVLVTRIGAEPYTGTVKSYFGRATRESVTNTYYIQSDDDSIYGTIREWISERFLQKTAD